MLFRCLRSCYIHDPGPPPERKDHGKAFRRTRKYELSDHLVTEKVRDTVLEWERHFAPIDDSARKARAARLRFVQDRQKAKEEKERAKQLKEAEKRAESEAKEKLLKEEAEKKLREEAKKSKAKKPTPAPAKEASSEDSDLDL